MIKAILPADQIPFGSIVTKLNGTIQYTLQDRIRVFTEGQSIQEIRATDGVRFIVRPTGDANAVGGGTELVWNVDADILIQYLSEYN